MATSNTYNFLFPQTDLIVAEAFERVGRELATITSVEAESAKRSLNFMLADWMNRGPNLWTIRRAMIGLTTGISVYDLPEQLSNVVTVCRRDNYRVLNGVAFCPTNPTQANNAFDSDPNTSCDAGVGGVIGYHWVDSTNTETPQSITLVGIQVPYSGGDVAHTIRIQYSNTGNTGDWSDVSDIKAQPFVATNIVYPQGQIYWFQITMPAATWLRIMAEDLIAPLVVSELYFCNRINDIPMTKQGADEYTRLPSTYASPGQPMMYWLDRQLKPVLHIFQAPQSVTLYNCIFYTYWSAMQDIGELMQSPEIPPRFLEALTSGLAYILGLKQKNMPISKLEFLQAHAADAFQAASREDVEGVPYSMSPDFMYGRT